MAILTKGQTFADADSVTSSKLNNLVDAATFVTGSSGTTDDSSLEVNVSGRLQIKDLGVSSGKIAASAVTTTKLPNSTLATDGVTYAKLQRVASMRVIGNTTGALAAASEVSILDEDDMASDSDAALVTQQSIKAYVDNEIAESLAIATPQNTTSGTSIDFTSIPSGRKRVTVMFNGVSTNGTSNLLVKIGTSSGIVSTGYVSGSWNGSPTTSTEGFNVSGVSAAGTITGLMTICALTGNVWAASHSCTQSNGNPAIGAGKISLGGTLDRVRITTVNGTDTFDAGSVTISYE